MTSKPRPNYAELGTFDREASPDARERHEDRMDRLAQERLERARDEAQWERDVDGHFVDAGATVVDGVKLRDASGREHEVPGSSRKVPATGAVHIRQIDDDFALCCDGSIRATKTMRHEWGQAVKKVLVSDVGNCGCKK